MTKTDLKVQKENQDSLDINLAFSKTENYKKLQSVEKNQISLSEIEFINNSIETRYKKYLKVDYTLTRGLVSFQGNKTRSVYRWYKFKEAFSADLVEYLLNKYCIKDGILLDPFAGSGTALFVSSKKGILSEGVELLPIGQQLIHTKKLINDGLTLDEIISLKRWAKSTPWINSQYRKAIPEFRITKGAYGQETLIAMEKFLYSITLEGPKVSSILLFTLLCVLESISFTRKDGQYLRWDSRSERHPGKRSFNKGKILDFDKAISAKLDDIISDLTKDDNNSLPLEALKHGDITLHKGSCLEILPKLLSNYYNCIITSPPYCNRYDYTRTYALELALLGVDEKWLRQLRQDMLSCTVENRGKDLISMNPNWATAITATDNHKLLQLILTYLQERKDNGSLNNSGIPRMVRGYFYEMACVIYECNRVLKPGANMIMVNDNVRYAGVSIPVDLILSDIALTLGFTIDNILVLPKGKGNSSQQMGMYGADRLRKCVYVWRKK